MKENPKYYKSDIRHIKTDRLIIAGRRGTGKSTGVKLDVASGIPVVWVVDTNELAASLWQRFVPPAVAYMLPAPKPIDDKLAPVFDFGQGRVRVVTWRQIKTLRDTGVDVGGMQAAAIIRDEAFRTDGLYMRGEPELLDDLAGTLGRSGKLPKIVVIGNPRSNAQPYSYTWHVNILAEGLYTAGDGLTTQVRGTADCADCFGRKIGVDASTAEYCKTLNSGGQTVNVNGTALRIRELYGRLYVGHADEGAITLLARDRWTTDALRPAGTRFLMRCRRFYDDDMVVYDSFDSELAFYRLLRLRE